MAVVGYIGKWSNVRALLLSQSKVIAGSENTKITDSPEAFNDIIVMKENLECIYVAKFKSMFVMIEVINYVGFQQLIFMKTLGPGFIPHNPSSTEWVSSPSGL